MENWSPIQLEEFKNQSDLVVILREDYEKCGAVLKVEIEKNSKRGNNAKICLISLGALIATKGIVDQLMISYDKNILLKNAVLISFTLIGIAISVVAGFDGAFKYQEKASGLRILSAEVQSNIRKGLVNQGSSYNTHVFEEGMLSLKKTISELNEKLSEIYAKAASFGLDLASKANY